MAMVDPTAWRDAGQVFQSEAVRFSIIARRELGALATTPSDGGIEEFDGLVAGMLPAVMGTVDSTIDGIAENLAAEGAALLEMGDTYANAQPDIEQWDEEELV